MYHSLMLLAGMLLLFYSSTLPTTAEFVVLAMACMVFYRCKLPRLRLLASFLFAYGWAGLFALNNQADRLPEDFVNQTATLTACIIEQKVYSASYRRILINVSNASVDKVPAAFKGKVSLSDYHGGKQTYQNGWCGEIIAKLKPVHGRLNQRGFDYEAWAYVNNIKATGTLKSIKALKPGIGLSNRYRQFKSKLVRELSQNLEHASAYELVISLALGERSLISNQQWTLLRQTGTSHLLAISGLHIGFVFWITSLLISMLWRTLGTLSLYISAQKAGWLMGLGVAAGYLLLCGAPLSGRRAWIMLACCVVLWIFDERVDFKFTLAFALGFVLLIWPDSVLAIGFWFSFTAVAVIVSQFVHLRMTLTPHTQVLTYLPLEKFIDMVKIQCLLSIAIIPLNVIYFGEISLVSPLANLFAVPLVTLVLLPVIILATVLHLLEFQFVSVWLLGQASHLLELMLNGLKMLANQSGSVYLPVINNQYGWYLVLIGYLIYQYLRLWPGRWLAVFLFFPLLINPKSAMQSGEFEVNVFDVGQGLAIWINTQHHNLLVDTGFGIDNGFSYVESVIYPVLKSQGINQIDALILSHGDADHAGGLTAILSSDLDIIKLYSSKKQSRKIGAYCKNSLTWRWDDIDFEFLTVEQVTGSNNQSCVLKIRSPYGTLLLPGDIERQAEMKLVNNHGVELNADLLIIPHHGSSSSSSAQFIHYVDPDFALVSAGYLNRYGHPTEKIKARYRNAQISVLNTACDGQLIFSVLEKGIKYKRLRQDSAPFWRHQCQHKAVE